MDYKDTFNTEKEKSKLIESKNKLITIKSDIFCEKYSSVELEIIPVPSHYCKFININGEDKKYFHIY